MGVCCGNVDVEVLGFCHALYGCSCCPLPCRVSAGELPSLQQLGFDAATLQRCANDKSAAGARLHGGESEAMRRLTDFIKHFTSNNNTAISSSSSSSSGGAKDAVAAAPNFCCKISPWLALGCLSPRQLYEQLQQKLAGHQQQQQQQLRAAGQGSDSGELRITLGMMLLNQLQLQPARCTSVVTCCINNAPLLNMAAQLLFRCDLLKLLLRRTFSHSVRVGTLFLCCCPHAMCCPADMQWLLYELLWRDFFRFITKKYANAGVPQHTAAPATAAMAMA